MSRALFEQVAGERHVADSAGTQPAERVHPEVVEVMREMGIDMTAQAPKKLSQELVERADVVVTMGCGDKCPVLPGKRYIEWKLPDPKGRNREEVRVIRDRVKNLIMQLVKDLDTQTH